MTSRARQPIPAAKKQKTSKINRITGERFRLARRDCWLTLPQAAKVLHVTPRTLHNWETGACRVPYAAYKLMRIMAGCDLGQLSPAWDGWLLRRGKLISPEGREFSPGDSAWWSLLLRARMFSTVSEKARLEGDGGT